ncbi:hypothetical protein A9Q80_05945 [Cycloclasticus sp. 46_83_sub15_T18]|nr:hypothetical protein A9Q80_05945 [Cycloclasticus sp. 46_83_sub15_T18]
MPHLRPITGKHLLYSLLILTALSIPLFAFLPTTLLPYPEILSLLMNALHFPAGFFMVFFAFRYVPLFKRHHCLLLFLACVIFAAIEVIQPMFGRTASKVDFLVSALGILLAWIYVRVYLFMPKGTRSASLLIALSTFSYLAYPGLKSVYHVYQAHQVFPLILNLETPRYKSIIKNTNHSVERQEHPVNDTDNVHYLRLNKIDKSWPSAHLNIFQHDWHDYSHLCFKARGGNAQTRLLIRFNDNASLNSSSSSTRELIISAQWEDYCINYTQLKTSHQRKLNIHNISQLIFFLDHKRADPYIELDNIQLI